MGSSMERFDDAQFDDARFDDVNRHAAAVNSWQQTYTQISAGRLQSSLMQLASARCHLFREQLNQRVVQQGQAPRGRVCFALPICVPGTAHMQGREADHNSLFCLRGGQEFMFHMPRGMDLLALTFDETFFLAVADSTRMGNIAHLIRQPVIKVSPRRLAVYRQQWLGRIAGFVACPGQARTTLALDALERGLLADTLALLAHPGCEARQARSTSSYIVEKLHGQTLRNTIEAPNIFEASRRLRVSRRTVQNSFRSVAETTPLNYLRTVRLNGVRRELMGSRADQVSIGDVAARWGFFHMSHFARAYRTLFGELPSQTRRAGQGLQG